MKALFCALLLALSVLPGLGQQEINGYRIFDNVAAPATPASGKTAVYTDSTSKKLCSKDDPGSVNCTGGSGSGSSIPDPFTQRYTIFIANCGTGTITGDSFNGSTLTSGAPDATNGAYNHIDTTTANGNAVAINGNSLYRTGRNIEFKARAWPASAGLQRFWLGLYGSVVAATVNGADDPAGADMAAFRYQPAVLATNFECFIKDSSTGEHIDSGVAVDGNAHDFKMAFNDTANTLSFYIDGTAVCGSPLANGSHHVPRAGINLSWILGVTNQETNSTAHVARMGLLRIVADK
jgi:hypothetical protein